MNAVDKQGNTGLHIACLKGNIHVVTALLYQPGAAEPLNVNAQNILHETPIFLAAKFGYGELSQEGLDRYVSVITFLGLLILVSPPSIMIK